MELLKNPETRFKGLTMLVKLVEVETLVSKAKKIIVEQLGATFVDAEYEADGLLARMALSGDVDLVMTEDTDLIVYGCSKILYKYKNGDGELYVRSEIFNMNGGSKLFENWELFQRFCVLCGCDYLKIGGVALGKAKKICRSKISYELWEKSQSNDIIDKINNILLIFNDKIIN